MKYKIGYQVTKDGYLIGEIKVRENPRKQGEYPCSKNVIFTEPPNYKKYTIRRWDGTKWEYVSDFRGNWWDKTTGEEIEAITEIGKQVELGKYTNNPPDGRFVFRYFNDLTGVWEENTIAKEEEERKIALLEIQERLNALDVKKIRYLLEKEKGDLSGKKYFDEYEAETLKLRKELKEL